MYSFDMPLKLASPKLRIIHRVEDVKTEPQVWSFVIVILFLASVNNSTPLYVVHLYLYSQTKKLMGQIKGAAPLIKLGKIYLASCCDFTQLWRGEVNVYLRPED